MAPSKKPASNAKPAKGSEKDKLKGKSSAPKDDKDSEGGKLKPATAINTRHILVLTLLSYTLQLPC